MPLLGRVLATFGLKLAEYIIDRIAERGQDKPQPLPFKEVQRLNELQKRAGRMNAKTVKLPRTPNRYDE